MKKRSEGYFRLSGLVIIAIVGVVWCVVVFKTKRTYDDLRYEVAEHILAVVEMDSADETFLDEVRTTWTLRYDDLDTWTEAIAAAELEPTVAGLVELYSYRMPEYSLLAPAENIRPLVIGALQSMCLTSSLDGAIHVASDKSEAFIQYTTNVVCVYRDVTNGVREEFYYVPTNDVAEVND